MDVMVTGGTGYIGTRLCAALAARGHVVRALVRRGRGASLPGIVVIDGNALSADDVAAALRPGVTLVHLVGTPHPNPSKAAEFERVDLASIRASVAAASRAGSAHLVYVSVAQPAPMMHAYVAVRAAGEAAIADARLAATILRPWYVLGPGHRWPLVLKPFYAIAKAWPATRETARRLDLVTIDDMVAALVRAVESPPPPHTQRIVDVPAIRAAGRAA
jgi:uncharacterized protein YbjT (DUF2867 family)